MVRLRSGEMVKCAVRARVMVRAVAMIVTVRDLVTGMHDMC